MKGGGGLSWSPMSAEEKSRKFPVRRWLELTHVCNRRSILFRGRCDAEGLGSTALHLAVRPAAPPPRPHPPPSPPPSPPLASLNYSFSESPLRRSHCRSFSSSSCVCFSTPKSWSNSGPPSISPAGRSSIGLSSAASQRSARQAPAAAPSAPHNCAYSRPPFSTAISGQLFPTTLAA